MATFGHPDTSVSVAHAGAGGDGGSEESKGNAARERNLTEKDIDGFKAPFPGVSFVKKGDRDYCGTISDVFPADREQLERHVKQEEHAAARKEYGCGDSFVIEGDLYRCVCCDFALTSRKVAAERKKEEKDMNNCDLPCVSILRMDANKYSCEICDTGFLDRKTIEDHVRGRKHVAAQQEYGCNYVSLKDDLYYCECCDSTLTSRKVASEHIKGEKHMNNCNLPCISILRVDANKYSCKICNMANLNRTTVEDHVRGRKHVAAQQEYGCNYVSLKDDLYYCKCCDFTLASRKVASNHIAKKKHRVNANFPCISIILTDVNKYHCAICDIDIDDEINLENHVKETQHTVARKKYGCDSITVRQGDPYYCICCDSTLTSRKLASEHIKEEKHMNSIDLPCISIICVDESKYHCKICDAVVLGKSNTEQHVKGRKHVAAQQQYGCNYVSLKDDLYYCECCDSTLTSRKVASNHIAEEKHMMALEGSNKRDQSTAKKIPEKAESVEQNSPDCPIFKEKQHDDVPASASTSLLDIHIVNVNGNLNCMICGCAIIDHTKVNDHVNENEHITGLQKFRRNQISFKNDGYYCKFCNCSIPTYRHVDDHIEGRNHKGILTRINQSFADNTISLQKELQYYCKCCNCKILGVKNVLQHIDGKNHKKLFKNHNESSNQAEKPIAKNEGDENVPKKPHPKTPTSPPSVEPAESSEATKANPARKRSNVKIRRVRKSPDTKVKSEKGEMLCSVCKATLVGAVNLHVHMAGHFSSDFVASREVKRAEEPKDHLESHQVEGNAKATREFADANGNEVAFVKRVEKPVNLKKVVADLDFDASDVYSLKDRTADIQLGMQLCYTVDQDRVYCLVCLKIVDCSIQDYPEHLRDLDHCEYLDRMEKDHELFVDSPGQFSDLDLARQYMQEASDDLVRCFACNEDVDNADDSLDQHVDDLSHRLNCGTLRAEARRNLENVKPICCDWYGVQTYWCVPCSLRFTSEVIFARHLRSEDHRGIMERKRNATRKLIIDFCAPCALLWYGYRCTWAYHCEIPSHVWLTRDGYYMSTEIPGTAERLLDGAEDYVDETMRHLDDVGAREREKEATVIRDIERAVKGKFRKAKAYIFGSRVTGLGSTDSDVDVFLDCGSMYDGANSSTNRILDFMIEVYNRLSVEPELWNIQELRTSARSPIIVTRHKVTGLSCDISFENGLAVENTLLIKSFIDIFPACRSLILVLKKWLEFCRLSGSDGITSYTLYCCVIFYLQKESILPSIAALIAMKKSSRIVAGWEVGVCRDFSCENPGRSFGIKELLTRFFTFYANFDYRLDVACPLLGKVVKKRAFAVPRALPVEMELYKTHAKKTGAAFRVDSCMCIQDPFDLQHNITKAVSKVYLNRFRKYCSKSLDVLRAF